MRTFHADVLFTDNNIIKFFNKFYKKPSVKLDSMIY